MNMDSSRSTLRYKPAWISRRLQWAIGIEYAVFALACFVLRPTLGSLFAPLLGPYAAALSGHSCGIANYLPLSSFTSLGLGVATFVVLSKWQTLWFQVPFWTWTIVWGIAAVLSVANTTE